ncbi:MAG: zinc ribbon domain-containing protein [Aggregatilineales bacterium]
MLNWRPDRLPNAEVKKQPLNKDSPVPSPAPATLLYRLQTIDLALAKGRARLKAIEDTLGQNAGVAAARTALTTVETQLAQWQTRARDLSLEIDSLIEKRDAAEKRLYSGIITNPKEMTDLQREIEALQRQRVKLDDDRAEAELEIEQIESNRHTAQDTLAQVEAAFAQSQAGLIAEKAQLTAEQATNIRRRQEAIAPIPPATLVRYDDLRAKKRGIAVALLKDGSCTVCGVEQTTVLSQQVRIGQQLILCHSCGRILAVQ